MVGRFFYVGVDSVTLGFTTLVWSICGRKNSVYNAIITRDLLLRC